MSPVDQVFMYFHLMKKLKMKIEKDAQTCFFSSAAKSAVGSLVELTDKIVSGQVGHLKLITCM